MSSSLLKPPVQLQRQNMTNDIIPASQQFREPELCRDVMLVMKVQDELTFVALHAIKTQLEREQDHLEKGLMCGKT